MARVVRVRSVDEAEDVNAEADKDAEADERTFAPDVEAIAKGGLAKALPEVDARLRLAMRGESAGAQSDTDADALTAKRAASTAEDQAVDIVACLKRAATSAGTAALGSSPAATTPSPSSNSTASRRRNSCRPPRAPYRASGTS